MVVASVAERKFPPGFKFGAATASYQVEGAWNVSGKFVNSKINKLSIRKILQIKGIKSMSRSDSMNTTRILQKCLTVNAPTIPFIPLYTFKMTTDSCHVDVSNVIDELKCLFSTELIREKLDI